MSNVLRIRGIKHDLTRFTASELQRAAQNLRREIADAESALAALAAEQRRRDEAGLPADVPALTAASPQPAAWQRVGTAA